MAEIQSLIDKIESNEIVLPEFQREFVWQKKQAKGLLNSLYQEFPIGSLLIWETENPPRIKNDAVKKEQHRLFKVLLDGQQRLTVLYMMVKDDIPPYYDQEEIRKDPRELHFNVSTGEFHYPNKTIRDNPEWVKVTEVFSEEADAFEIAKETVQEESKRYDKAQEYSNTINKLKNIVNRKMPIMELPKSADIGSAIELFDRVNSEGTDLGEPELALAHMSSEWAEIRREMKDKQRELKKDGFDFDLDFYVKCQVAALTGTMTYDKVYNTEKEKLVESWRNVEETLDFVKRFLRDDCYIPNSDYITTRAVLIPLVTYLINNENRLSREEKESFQRWIYAAMMWSRYSRATDTTLSKDLSLLGLADDEDPTSELVEQIIEDTGRIEVQASDLEKKGKRSKRFYNMVKIVTRANKPVDWKTGEPLKENYELESHHIFPKSELYDRKYSTGKSGHQKLVNEIANRAFVTTRTNKEIFTDLPDKYLPGIVEDHPKALEKQFIPENRELWKIKNYEDFLQKRRKMLAEEINNFVENLDRDGEENETSLEDLIESGENYRIEFKETFLWDVYREEANKELKEEIAQEICAFANSDGGTLIIGVKDEDKQVKGIKRDLKLMRKGKDDFELQVNQIISDKLGSKFGSIYTNLEFKTIESSEVCVITVEPSPDPVYYENGQDFYVRQGSSSIPLGVEEVTEYVREHFN